MASVILAKKTVPNAAQGLSVKFVQKAISTTLLPKVALLVEKIKATTSSASLVLDLTSLEWASALAVTKDSFKPMIKSLSLL